MTTDSTDQTATAAPTSPPREITSRVKRRSWHERRVRLWLILVVLLTATTTYFAIRDIRAALRERRLVQQTPRPATIDSIDEYEHPNRDFPREEPHHLNIHYTSDTGETYKTEIDLPGMERGLLRVGDTLDLRMDPDDPLSITLQSKPKVWTASLAVVCLLAPFTIVLAVMALLQRSGVIKTWRTGEAVEAVVVDSHRSGIAPGSEVLRFTLADDEDDRRVFSTLYPRAARRLSSGDAFWIVMPKNSPGRALVASLYS